MQITKYFYSSRFGSIEYASAIKEVVSKKDEFLTEFGKNIDEIATERLDFQLISVGTSSERIFAFITLTYFESAVR